MHVRSDNQEDKGQSRKVDCLPKVLHYVHDALPAQNGYAIRTHYIVANLQRMGYMPGVCTCPSFKGQGSNTGVGDNEAYLVKDDVPYFGIRPEIFRDSRVYPIVRVLSERRIRGMTRLRRNLEWRMYDSWVSRVYGKPDILHAHSPEQSAFEALSLARRWRVPLVYEVRGFWRLSLAACDGTTVDVAEATHGDVRAGGKANHVVAICKGIADVLVQGGIPPGKIDIVPNGVDTSAFRPLNRDEQLAREIGIDGKLVYGYATNVRRLEGIQDVVKAWKEVTKILPDAVFLLIGNGKYMDVLKELVREKGVGDTFRLLGRVPHAEMRAYYSLLDVFVVPRIPEPVCHIVTPLKPLEAMAMGIPVVASDVSALREMVQDGETGVLFEAGNSDSLAATCIEVGKDARLRRELSLKARQWVEKEREWAVVTCLYSSIYESLVR